MPVEAGGYRDGAGVNRHTGFVTPPPGSQVPDAPFSGRITDGEAHLFV